MSQRLTYDRNHDISGDLPFGHELSHTADPHLRKTRLQVIREGLHIRFLQMCGMLPRSEAEMVEYYLADWRDRQEKDPNIEDEDELLYPDIADPNYGMSKFCDTNRFNTGVAMVIILNAITIGLETEANLAGTASDTEGLWLTLEFVFGLLFLAELLTRFYCHRCDLCRRPSLAWGALMDIVVIAASFTNIVMIYIAQSEGSNARLVTMLRLARLLRLVRVLRLFRLLKELRMLLVGLISSFRILVWISSVLCLVCYCFAIWLTLLVGHRDLEFKKSFKDTVNLYTRKGYDLPSDFNFMHHSIFSMIQLLTVENSWDLFARHVVEDTPWLSFFFLGLFLIGTLALFNVMVGVVIERIRVTAAADNLYQAKLFEQSKRQIWAQLRSFFEASDTNENGLLSVAEVQEALNTPELYNKLKMIDFPVDDPGYMFRALDISEDSDITIQEFFDGCERASGPLLSKDLLVAQVAVETLAKHYEEFEEQFDDFQRKICVIASMAGSLTEHGEHIFLTTQEYRSRHPNFKHNTRPRISMAKLDKAPWENEKAHWKYSLGSWFDDPDVFEPPSAQPVPPPLPDGPVPPPAHALPEPPNWPSEANSHQLVGGILDD